MHTNLDEDGGNKMIYKMARHRNDYNNDVTGRTFIKDGNRKL